MRTDPSFIARGCTHHTILPSFLLSFLPFNPTLWSHPFGVWSPVSSFCWLVSLLRCNRMKEEEGDGPDGRPSIHPGVFERHVPEQIVMRFFFISYTNIKPKTLCLFFVVVFSARLWPSFLVITGSTPWYPKKEKPFYFFPSKKLLPTSTHRRISFNLLQGSLLVFRTSRFPIGFWLLACHVETQIFFLFISTTVNPVTSAWCFIGVTVT